MNYTVRYNPEMNSIAERLNRTLVEKARTMLHASGLDKMFWSEAIFVANYIKNRSPTNAIGEQFSDKTPAEIWFKTKPNLSNLRIFGATCFNHIPKEKRSKLDVKSSKCTMLGYAGHGTYRLWNTETNKLIFGRNVVFNENSILNRHNVNETLNSEAEENSSDDDIAENDHEIDDTQDSTFGHDVNLDDIGFSRDNFHGANLDCIGCNEDNINVTEMDGIGNNENNFHDANLDCIGDNVLRRSTRIRQKPERYGIVRTENDAHFALSAMQFVENDPLSITEAKQKGDWKEWEKAIMEEYSEDLD